MADYPIPLSPEEEARVRAYWGGEGLSSSGSAPSPTPNIPQPPPVDLAAAYYAGAPPPGPPSPPGLPPSVPQPPPGAAGGAQPPLPPAFPPPPAQAAPPPASPRPRDPVSFQRDVPKPHRPAGPSKPGNPDPYGIKAATTKMIGSYDAQAAAAGAMGDAQAAKADATAALQSEHAKRIAEDAELARHEDEIAGRNFDAQMMEIQQQLHDVKAKKIRPMTMMEASGELGGLGIIGAIVGGMYAGLTGKENPFLAEMNRVIDRQLAADEKNLDSEKEAVGQRMNLLGQQRQIFNDHRIAREATRNLYYESFKHEIEAEALKYDIPTYKANAADAIAKIEREQGGLQKQLGEALRAQSAAAANSQMARTREVQQAYRETYDKALAAGLAPQQAEFEAKRMVDVLYNQSQSTQRTPQAPGNDPLGNVPKALQNEAAKEFTAQASTGKVLTSIKGSFQDWRSTGTMSPRQLDSVRSAIAGTIMSSVPGIRSDVDFKEIVEPNLPKMGDSEETLRKKEATIARFVESKVATPILDAHSPGWRKPSTAEANAALGAKPLGR